MGTKYRHHDISTMQYKKSSAPVPLPPLPLALFPLTTVYLFMYRPYPCAPLSFFLSLSCVSLKPWIALFLAENATQGKIGFEQRGCWRGWFVESPAHPCPLRLASSRLASIHGPIDPPLPVWIVPMCPCAHSFFFCCLCSSSAVRLRALAGAIRVLRRGWGCGRGAVGGAYPQGRGK